MMSDERFRLDGFRAASILAMKEGRLRLRCAKAALPMAMSALDLGKETAR